MKKTFLFGMIALLSVSLVFMGCPQETDESRPAMVRNQAMQG